MRRVAVGMVVGLCLAAGLVVWGVDSGSGSAPSTGTAQAPVVIGRFTAPAAVAAAVSVSGHLPTPRQAPQVSAAQAVTRRFMAAWLPYEIDHFTSAEIKVLRATATRAFAQTLISQPPSVPRRERRFLTVGSVASVQGRLGVPGTVIVDVSINRGGQLSLIDLTLAQDAAGRWRVSRLAA